MLINYETKNGKWQLMDDDAVSNRVYADRVSIHGDVELVTTWDIWGERKPHGWLVAKQEQVRCG